MRQGRISQSGQSGSGKAFLHQYKGDDGAINIGCYVKNALAICSLMKELLF